jgi:ribosomal protein S15P/S13E
MGGQVQDRMKDQVNTRSTQAGEQVTSITEGIRKMGEHFQSQGQDAPARMTEQAAQRADQLAGYLRRSDADTILRDVEEFGRRQPWVLVAGGVAAGFLASRFLKASSSRRQGAGAAGGGQMGGRYVPTAAGGSYGTTPAVSTYEDRGGDIYEGSHRVSQESPL